MKVILSPHPEKTAGYKFDENYAEKNDFQIISLKSPSKLINLVQLFISLPFVPFMGVYGAITFIRVLSKLNVVKQCSEVCISRSLFPSVLLPGKTSVLYHNIELLYYFEEAKASKSFLKKAIFYHQFLVLKLFEFKGLGNSLVICLSMTESRLLNRKKRNAVFSKSTLFTRTVKDEQFLSEFDGMDICFFGAFNNVRNIEMAENLQEVYPNIRFFGRHGELLPSHLKVNYKGEIDDFSKFVNSNVLVMIEAPKAGVQTKVVDWLENGGKVFIPNNLRRKMWGKLNER
ncbi:hypothetical protein J8M20_11960 [Pseudoalteromonas luteoviolacea]|uniref:hypothetical protein n=1 Tax=Pseudoalteromonas luteoviolacea TaxID=43657 RepID=UPI001B39C633|nr:hypothetical protein [Pseudoalteromonas luteoviolacea]MBQ4812061.1 hypothetical protein [Pseudoalteromonas luteoviolacea]